MRGYYSGDNAAVIMKIFLQVIEAGGLAVSKEPFELRLASLATPPTAVPVTLTFHGHYNEPSVSLDCPLGRSKVYDLTYDLSNAVAGWSVRANKS